MWKLSVKSPKEHSNSFLTVIQTGCDSLLLSFVFLPPFSQFSFPLNKSHWSFSIIVMAEINNATSQGRICFHELHRDMFLCQIWMGDNPERTHVRRNLRWRFFSVLNIFCILCFSSCDGLFFFLLSNGLHHLCFYWYFLFLKDSSLWFLLPNRFLEKPSEACVIFCILYCLMIFPDTICDIIWQSLSFFCFLVPLSDIFYQHIMEKCSFDIWRNFMSSNMFLSFWLRRFRHMCQSGGISGIFGQQRFFFSKINNLEISWFIFLRPDLLCLK